MKSYNDVIISARKRGNNKKKKDIDEEIIDDTNTRELVGKDLGKDEDSVDDIYVEYLNDEKIQNDNVIVQRSAEEAKALAEFRSTIEWEKINNTLFGLAGNSQSQARAGGRVRTSPVPLSHLLASWAAHKA